MNRLWLSLARICATYKLKEKILTMPSFSQGHQITESLVENGFSYINLRINTLSSLAHEIVALEDHYLFSLSLLL